MPNDELRNTLLSRAWTGPAGMPTALPSDPARVPPRWKRFVTAEKMKGAYRNDWQPNPMIVRLLNGGR